MNEDNNLKVYILINQELIDRGVNKENNKEFVFNSYGTSTKQFSHINNVLKRNKIQFNYITWEKFNQIKHCEYDIFLLPGSNFTDDLKHKFDINIFRDSAVKNGSNFIFLSWQPFEVSQFIDVDRYKGNKRKWGIGPIKDYTILLKDEVLLKDLNTFSYPISGLDTDNYWLLPKDSPTNFKTLIVKPPKKSNDRFISFGYQQLQEKQYIFLIDMVNREININHHIYLEKRLDNVIKFFTSNL